MGWMTEISGLSPPLKSQVQTVIPPLSQPSLHTYVRIHVFESIILSNDYQTSHSKSLYNFPFKSIAKAKGKKYALELPASRK